ncbi:ABC transporter permease subunit [Clostridium oceanicum]|uniref:ABC transporter permease subunit n=1 Tax=Clostridium oceanicum TaxID=1543 RepID=A0ABP3V5E5_9CLOT
MLNLFKSEWQRLYSKKTTWLCFLLIPVIIMGSAKYCLFLNLSVNSTDSKFTQFYNFPVASIQELGSFSINMILILLIVLCVTEEFTNGSIRLVLIRPIKKGKVFLAKFLVIISTIFLILIVYLILSYILGYIIFPKSSSVTAFFWKRPFNPHEMFLYTLKYYSMLFLTLIAIATLEFFISIISKSVTISIGVNIGIYLFLLIYPRVIEIFISSKNPLLFKIQWLSVAHIQFEGIAAMLSQYKVLGLYSLTVLFIYIILFFILNHFIYCKKDHLI